MDKIVVLDFGSQYSHLICRRIRDFSVYAELVPYDISLKELKKLNPKGIIFSGDHLVYMILMLLHLLRKFSSYKYQYWEYAMGIR